MYDLRHTAASLMLNSEIAPIIVSRRLGHARASITLDIYGHLIPSMQSEAAEKIDGLITPPGCTGLHPICANMKQGLATCNSIRSIINLINQPDNTSPPANGEIEISGDSTDTVTSKKALVYFDGGFRFGSLIASKVEMDCL